MIITKYPEVMAIMERSGKVLAVMSGKLSKGVAPGPKACGLDSIYFEHSVVSIDNKGEMLI